MKRSGIEVRAAPFAVIIRLANNVLVLAFAQNTMPFLDSASLHRGYVAA
jgi:hypothetical protein